MVESDSYFRLARRSFRRFLGKALRRATRNVDVVARERSSGRSPPSPLNFGNAESNCPTGQHWRAVKVAGGATDFMERTHPSRPGAREWGAFKMAEAIAAENALPPEFGRLFNGRAPRLG